MSSIFGGGGGVTVGTTTVTGGTTGSVLFVGASSVLQQDNTNFFWDDTNNRLGLRTASPSSIMHMNGGDSYRGFAANTFLGTATNISMMMEESANNSATAFASVSAVFNLYVKSGSGNFGASDVKMTVASTGSVVFTQTVQTSGTPTHIKFTGAAHTTLAAITEAIDIDFALNRTVQFATGGFAAQRAVVFRAPTYAAVGASAITAIASVAITGPAVAGTNVTTSDALALWIQSGRSRIDGTLGIGATSGVGTVLGVVQAGQVGTVKPVFALNGGAHATMTASTEYVDCSMDFSRTVSFSAGAITTNRSMFLSPPTLAAGGASVITTAVGLSITTSPAAGSNVTITNDFALRVGGSVSIGPTSAAQRYAPINVPAHTVTVTGTTQVTAAGSFSQIAIDTLTITDASAVTIDAVAGLYIAAAPVAAGSVTLTKSYSMWIDAGLPRIDSVTANNTVATVLTAVGPTGANTTVQEWLTIDINGTTRFIPCW